MKLFISILPFTVGIFLVGSLAIFIAGTFIFLAIQAFYDIQNYSGSAIVAYLVIVAGVMIFSCVAYKTIKCGYCYCANRKKNLSESRMNSLDPAVKILISFILYEGIKLYMSYKNNKDTDKK